MAKKSLFYWNRDTNMRNDAKVRSLGVDLGIKGIFVYEGILDLIYGGEGYYMEWNEDTATLVACSVGYAVTTGLVVEVVNSCLRWGLFDKYLYETWSILSSKGIQDRYERCATSLKRGRSDGKPFGNSYLNPKYNLGVIAMRDGLKLARTDKTPLCTDGVRTKDEFVRTKDPFVPLEGKKEGKKEVCVHTRTSIFSESVIQDIAMKLHVSIPELSHWLKGWCDSKEANIDHSWGTFGNKNASFAMQDFVNKKQPNGFATAHSRPSTTQIFISKSETFM
jgi:hypothetical protein